MQNPKKPENPMHFRGRLKGTLCRRIVHNMGPPDEPSIKRTESLPQTAYQSSHAPISRFRSKGLPPPTPTSLPIPSILFILSENGFLSVSLCALCPFLRASPFKVSPTLAFDLLLPARLLLSPCDSTRAPQALAGRAAPSAPARACLLLRLPPTPSHPCSRIQPSA